MRGIIATLSCLCMIAAAVPAHAQATKLGTHNAWGSYAYQTQSGKVCYVLSVPTAKQPGSLNHGDIFFFVSQKPGQNVAFEPQFIAGYSLQTDSKVQVTIGDRSFSLFSRENSAWLENAAEEPQLVAAMRGGSTMQVKAVSGRGNPTSYEFSLSGITAALNSIQSCR